jgi:hypothetical protein
MDHHSGLMMPRSAIAPAGMSAIGPEGANHQAGSNQREAASGRRLPLFWRNEPKNRNQIAEIQSGTPPIKRRSCLCGKALLTIAAALWRRRSSALPPKIGHVSR